jgi:hypothetical protein
MTATSPSTTATTPESIGRKTTTRTLPGTQMAVSTPKTVDKAVNDVQELSTAKEISS